MICNYPELKASLFHSGLRVSQPGIVYLHGNADFSVMFLNPHNLPRALEINFAGRRHKFHRQSNLAAFALLRSGLEINPGGADITRNTIPTFETDRRDCCGPLMLAIIFVWG